MTHEKRGVIEDGRTPPENTDEKQASKPELEEHPTTRAAQAAADSISGNVKSADDKRSS